MLEEYYVYDIQQKKILLFKHPFHILKKYEMMSPKLIYDIVNNCSYTEEEAEKLLNSESKNIFGDDYSHLKNIINDNKIFYEDVLEQFNNIHFGFLYFENHLIEMMEFEDLNYFLEKNISHIIKEDYYIIKDWYKQKYIYVLLNEIEDYTYTEEEAEKEINDHFKRWDFHFKLDVLLDNLK